MRSDITIIFETTVRGARPAVLIWTGDRNLQVVLVAELPAFGIAIRGALHGGDKI